ncbi:MAG: polysaccharide biosynthesis protein [Clostridia bacterium]|nr:polysaccharide biosynthesis protein [Clostridia bacterium]
MSERKKQSLLTGAGILAIATVVVKLIGAIYKIPLTNLIGAEGYGYFTGAYAVYTPLYAISMAGLPVAVAALVSQNVETGRIKDAQRIFAISKKLFLGIGLVCTLLLVAVAYPYSRLVGAADNYISIIVIAPCVLFCCLMSAYRGYYEGLNNMTPTGVSQVVEAVFKLVIGLAGAYLFMTKALGYYRENAADGVLEFFGKTVTDESTALSALYPYAAAVAIFGVTAGSMASWIYLFILYKRKGAGYSREELVNSPEAKSSRELTGKLLRIAIPVAASSVILNLTNIIDDFTIRARLNFALAENGEIIKNMYADALSASQTLESGISTYLYGVHGAVINIKNLIPTITLTLGISAIPVISKAWAIKDMKGIRVSTESAMRVAMIIALPAGFGIAALSEPILELLYSSRAEIVPVAAPLLRTYGFAMFLFAIASPLTNILQALGNTKAPIISILAGAAAKLVYNYIVIAKPEINIRGAAGASVLCYVIMAGLNLIQLLHCTHIRLDYVSVFLKPFVAAVACGGTAWGVFKLLTGSIGISSKLSCLISIACGATVYAIVLLIIKGIVKDDLEMLPKGEKIEKILAKFKLLG